MTWELFVAVAIPVLLGAVAWGDMRAQIQANRDRQDERHAESLKSQDRRHGETHDVMKNIAADVRRINGTVTDHTAKLIDHADEIDRLRRQR